MAVFPATPLRPDTGPPACPGTPIRRRSNSSPPPSNGNSITDSSPITPIDPFVATDLESHYNRMRIRDENDTSKEVVVEGGGGAVQNSLHMSSTNQAAGGATAYTSNGKGGILTTSGNRGTAKRDSNWRQRGVSFALPPEHSDDLVSKGQNVNPSTGEEVKEDMDDDPKCAELLLQNSPTPYRPRGDREPTAVSNENAQALLPPNFCVFVANLSAQLADDVLEIKVKDKFEQFGNCYVKIKRDARGMPFAFCQYENVEDVERAIVFGRGTLIEGRMCRTERAKVNRALFLSRITGGAITEEEAREILRGFGDLEKVWVSSDTDKEMYRLPDGIWVQFAYFQDCRDAQMTFKENPHFRLEQPPLPEEIRSRLGRSPVHRSFADRTTNPHVREPSHDIKVERGVVFVGNMPPDCSQIQVKAVFDRFGRIDTVELVSRQSAMTPGLFNHFAYITYARDVDAQNCVAHHDPVYLHGNRLRVEFKESKAPRPAQTPRRRINANVGATEVSRPFLHRDTAVGRAIEAGVSPTLVARIFDTDAMAANAAAAARAVAAANAATGGPFYQVPYVRPYAYSTQYSAYAALTAPADYRHASSAVYGATINNGHTSGQYQSSQYQSGQYQYAGLPYATGFVTPYVYAPAAMGNNGHHTATSNGNGHGHPRYH